MAGANRPARPLHGAGKNGRRSESMSDRTGYIRAKAFDLLPALPIVLLLLLAIAGTIPQIVDEAHQLAVSFQVVLGLAVPSQVVGATYLGLLAALFVLRRLPEWNTRRRADLGGRGGYDVSASFADLSGILRPAP
jgi:hypothetical protein